MRVTLFLISVIGFLFLTAQSEFITKWTFTSAATQIEFNSFTDGPVAYTWSASPSGNSGSGSFTSGVVLSGLTIDAGDEVTLVIDHNNLKRFYIDYGYNREHLTEVSQWGNVEWSNMSNAFRGCTNLQITANDVPNLSNVTDMSYMFSECTYLNSPSNINSWNTSNVRDMSSMFYKTYEFNQDISNWNTSSVMNMSYMFSSAYLFNQDIGNWDISNVTSVQGMFSSANSFNQDIGNWNTSSIVNLIGMFQGATSFNQNINSWNMPLVTTMRDMFHYATSFNQNIGNWNTSSVVEMVGMFRNASSFNQNIGNWDTGNVVDIWGMFFGATAFNQDIGNWNTSNVKYMSDMFYGATTFNQNIGNWNTAKVTDMTEMFHGATSFNQDISIWNTANVKYMNDMFNNATSFNQNISNWSTYSVTEMRRTFKNATSFNQNLSNWTLNLNVFINFMLDSSGLDCENYSNTLIGWQTNNPNIYNKNLGAVSMTYNDLASTSRNILVNVKGWSINGDLLTPNCISSLDEYIKQDNINIYPNPNNGLFSVSISEFLLGESLTITNTYGQVLETKSVNKTLNEYDLSNLSNGVYFIHIQTENDIVSKKFIKD